MPTRCPSGRHDQHNVYAERCPCRALLDLLANKWSALAIGLLDERDRMRFSELQAALPGVGAKDADQDPPAARSGLTSRANRVRGGAAAGRVFADQAGYQR